MRGVIRALLLVAVTVRAHPVLASRPTDSGPPGTVLLSAGRVFLIGLESGNEAVFTVPATIVEGVGDITQVEPGDRVRIEGARRVPGGLIAGRVTVLPKPAPVAPPLLSPAELAGESGPDRVRPRIVDCRKPEAWERGHVPGAVPAGAPGGLPSGACGSEDVVLVDGDGYGDAALPVFQALARTGCLARVLRGGTAAYARAGFLLTIESGGVSASPQRSFVLVDVRSRDAYRRGHLPGAAHVPLDEMSWEEFSSPVGMPGLVFYADGPGDVRAEEAANRALRWRFQQASQVDGPVAVLAGGFGAWAAEGRAVETGEPARAFTAATVRHPDEAGPEEASQLLSAEPPAAVLVDLRERRMERPAGSIHLPLEELPARIHELPREREILVFCSQGVRSRIAVGILRAHGLKARFTRDPGPR